MNEFYKKNLFASSYALNKYSAPKHSMETFEITFLLYNSRYLQCFIFKLAAHNFFLMYTTLWMIGFFVMHTTS